MAQIGLAGPFSYDEGFWTPVLQFGGASVGMTYLAHTGYYIRTGNMVFVTCCVQLTAKGTSVGIARVSGLPFKLANDYSAYSAAALRFYDVSFTGQFQGAGILDSLYVRLEQVTEAGVHTELTNANFANDSLVLLTMVYRTE